MPQAWRELTNEVHEQLLEALIDKAEALCGYKPAQDEVIRFLRNLKAQSFSASGTSSPAPVSSRSARSATDEAAATVSNTALAKTSGEKTITFTYRGDVRTAPNASVALVEILRSMLVGHEENLPELARAVRGTKINHIGQSPEEINPAQPHLARAVEIAPGWSVGLNISNQTKLGIIRSACELLCIRMPEDLDVRLPNAN
ncbi:hypothetical protein [Sphingomonas swuensis]|uniref:hypothetical protein n=1 Tax=Sphingomonas swuensis TaxID=977800 RepID=UPI0031E20176